MSTDNKTFVLSLGGSLVVPNGGIDIKFLIAFNKFIRNQISSKKRRFFIVVGGGATTRHYQAAASAVHGAIEDIDLDWIGIHATRLNAHLLRIIFRDLAHSHVLKHYEVIRKSTESVVIAGGYDKDPKKFPNAKPIDHISWNAYRKMVGGKWIPGMNSPFDPIASKLADEMGVTVKIVNGKNLDNLTRALDGKKFVGTTIA